MIKLYQNKLEYIWYICNQVEIKIGFNKLSELICSNITYLFLDKKIKKLLKNEGKKLIIVSIWMPSYLQNIEEILIGFKKDGYRIFIFPEWKKSKELKYNVEMNKYNDFHIIHNSHRILPKIKTELFLSSTATKHFYFSKCKHRFFYFHSIAGLDGFPEGGLDDYTDFLCASKQQYKELKNRFDNINIKKSIHKAGYPKLDKIINRLLKEKKQNKNQSHDIQTEKNTFTILIAPSFASDDIYSEISLLPIIRNLIFSLLKENYKVIFRPHPVSLRRGKFVSMLKLLENEKINNFNFDKSQDYFETYSKSDLMITDVSGTSMIYRVAFNKPVIFFNQNNHKAKKALKIIDKLGPTVSNIESLKKIIKSEKINNSQRINEIYNLGKSSKEILKLLKSKI